MRARASAFFSATLHLRFRFLVSPCILSVALAVLSELKSLAVSAFCGCIHPHAPPYLSACALFRALICAFAFTYASCGMLRSCHAIGYDTDKTIHLQFESGRSK